MRDKYPLVLNLFLKVKEPAKEQPPQFFHETTRVLWDFEVTGTSHYLIPDVLP